MKSLPDDIDPECITLCNAINSLPGLETFESCCGHGTEDFVIFFKAKTIKALKPLLEEIDSMGRWRWKIDVTWSSGSNFACFCLFTSPDHAHEANEFAKYILNRFYELG